MNVYGIVENYDDKLGHGSIKEFDGNELYLAHRRDVKTFHTLEKGNIVLFDRTVEDGTRCAKYIRVVEV